VRRKAAVPDAGTISGLYATDCESEEVHDGMGHSVRLSPPNRAASSLSSLSLTLRRRILSADYENDTTWEYMDKVRLPSHITSCLLPPITDREADE